MIHSVVSLLFLVLFKILERLIYARVDAIMDGLLLQEQAGFRHGRSAVDQVTLSGDSRIKKMRGALRGQEKK